MIGVTVVGDINVDLITSKLVSFPERDSQKVISDLRMSSGGCAANFAKAISQLGLKVRLIGKLGNDSWGELVQKSLKKGGVDLKISRGKKTGLTFALNFLDNSRSFITYPGANSELNLKDIKLKQIQGKYLHVASFFLQGLREKTVKLLRYAHLRGMKVSLDTGWDPTGWSEKDKSLVKKTLSEVDIFFPDLREGEAITNLKKPEEICKSLLSLGPGIIALKLGKKGCFLAKEGESRYLPSFKVKVADTTGAGDVFDAAFIYGRYQRWSLEKTGKFANCAAALSTQGYGSNNYPKLGDVERAI